MTARIVRIEAIALVALSLAAACSDERKDLLAPQAPDKMILQPIGGPITDPVLRPRFPNPGDFMDIAAGGNHTCARKYNGDVLCWGSEGEAGYEKIIQTPTLAFSGASQIAVGYAHACALNNAGAAYCWGGGEEGQLGIMLGAMIGWSSGAVLGPKDPTPYSYATLAPLVFSSITAGGYSTCGLAASGVYCWGKLGDYTNPGFMSIPNLVVTGGNYSWSGFAQIAIGEGHVCGHASGSVMCWGADAFAQAGSDPATAVYYPGTKQVMFAMNSGITSGATRVSAGGEFTCADMAAGTVQCFGKSTDGQLGNAPAYWFSAAPQAVGGGMALHGVAAGSRHACALDANSEAWCWGYNYNGAVGNGTWSYSTSTAQKVLGVSTGYQTNGATIKFRALAAGSMHTCGIGTDNHIYCWGNNYQRQLGTWLVGSNGQTLPLGSGWVPAPVLVM